MSGFNVFFRLLCALVVTAINIIIFPYNWYIILNFTIKCSVFKIKYVAFIVVQRVIHIYLLHYGVFENTFAIRFNYVIRNMIKLIYIAEVLCYTFNVKYCVYTLFIHIYMDTQNNFVPVCIWEVFTINAFSAALCVLTKLLQFTR